MDKKEIFSILEIEETKDEELLKQAYRAKLVRTNPEDDPEGFLKLRQAYEEAQMLATQDEDNDNTPKTEVDLWIEKVKKVYYSVSLRANEQAWSELLKDEVCVGLDTEEEAKEKLLVMAMECCNIPHKIWCILNEEFNYLAEYDKLCEIFPKNYIDFIFGQMKYDDFIDYELFLGDDDGDIDALINVIFRLKEAFDMLEEEIELDDCGEQEQIERMNAIDKLLEQADACTMKHPYVDAIRMRFYCLKDRLDEANEIMMELEDGFGDINGKEFMANLFVKYSVSKVYEHMGEMDHAHELRLQVLEKAPFHRGSGLDEIKYYYNKQEYEKAKEASLDYLEKYGNHPVALEYMRKANELIMQEHKKKADEGNIESVYDLGWCYFQNEMYDECISLVSEYEPAEGDEYEFEYMNLTGRCMAAAGKFEEALERLKRWQTILYSLEDDGTEKYQKRIKRKGYSYYVIGMCQYSIWEREKNDEDLFKEVLKNMEKAIEEETDSRELLYYRDRLAMIYCVSGYYTKCIDLCTEILGEVPQYYMAYVFRQEAYYNLDYPRNVVEDFYEAIKYYNKDYRTYELAMKTLFEYRQYEELENVLKMAYGNHVESDAIDIFRIKLKWKSAVNEGRDYSSTLNSCLKELFDFEEKYITQENECDMEDKSDITYTIALISLDLGRRADGFRYLQKTIEINEKKQENVYWVLANVYAGENDYRNELKILKKIKKLDKDNIEIRFRMGKCYWCLDENDKAKRAFDKVYKMNPQHRLINSYLTDYYVYMFREKEDKSYWNKAMMHATKQYEIEECAYYLIKIGQLYWEIYDIDNMVEIFKKVKEMDNTYIDADYYLAHAAMLEWDCKTAYSILSKALALKVETQCINDQIIYKEMVDVCIALGRFDEALTYIKKCVKRYPSKEWEHRQTQNVLDRQGAKEALLKHMTRVRIEKISDKVSSQNIALETINIAEIYFRIDKQSQGVKEIKQAIVEAHNDEATLKSIYDKCVVIYTEIVNQPKIALKYAMKSLRVSYGTDCIGVYLRIARISAKCGQRRKAVTYFKKYIECIKENYGELKNYFSDTAPSYLRARLYNLGEYFYNMQDIDNLQTCIGRMENVKPCMTCNYCDCYELILLKGYLEELKGNAEKALVYFEKANVINNYDSFTDNIVKDRINKG